jgi:hypothetical protein
VICFAFQSCESYLKTLLFSAVALLAQIAIAVTPVTLIGPDLEPKRVNLQGLDDESLSFFDADRQYRTLPVDRVLQLRELSKPPAPTQADAARGWIETADGQKIYGTLDVEHTTRDKIAWANPTLGLIEVGVDDIKSVALRAMAVPAKGEGEAAVRDDRIVLANGDSILGMLIGAGAEGVEIKVGDAAEPAKLPWERLRGFVLFNAAPRKQQPAHRIWLADGSRLLARKLSLVADQISFQPLFKPIKPSGGAAAVAPASDANLLLPFSRLTRIDLFATADPSHATRRLIDLADVPMKTVSGGEVFGVPLPPYSDELGLHMHAPVKTAFTLPPGAKRFAATAELDLSPQAPRAAPPMKQASTPQERARQQAVAGQFINGGAGQIIVNGPGQVIVRRIAGVAGMVVAPAVKAAAKDGDKDKPAVTPPLVPDSSEAGMSLSMRGDRESDAGWADFEVIALLNEKEIGRFRINAQTRKLRINLPLDAPSTAAQPATLELEVVPGANGPVMDRLRLSDAAVLVMP